MTWQLVNPVVMITKSIDCLFAWHSEVSIIYKRRKKYSQPPTCLPFTGSKWAEEQKPNTEKTVRLVLMYIFIMLVFHFVSHYLTNARKTKLYQTLNGWKKCYVFKIKQTYASYFPCWFFPFLFIFNLFFSPFNR